MSGTRLAQVPTGAGRRLRFLMFLAVVAGFLPCSARGADRPADAPSIQVGPTRAIRTIAEASKIARDGDTVEIDAGDYVGDVAIWTQDRLTLRGAGSGTVRLLANGRAAEGKAIWVVRGGEILIENIVFSGAKVPDRNGAGIRLEKGRLTVRRCHFLNNENGILTANRDEITLAIENSEFGHNGAGDGQSHNLYVGSIGRLVVTGSYFHHAVVGHLLKSRARVSVIRYNRLTDESGGRASYELEFPSGGMVIVVGNILHQSQSTENPHMLSFGAEGYRWPVNSISISYNTFVDDRSAGGVFFRLAPGLGASSFVNNLYVGSGRLSYPSNAVRFGNMPAKRDDLVSVDRGDYRFRDINRAASLALPLPPDFERALIPTREYEHPVRTRELKTAPVLPGAFQ